MIHHQQSEEGTRPFEDQLLAEEIKLHKGRGEVHDQEHQYVKTFGDAQKDSVQGDQSQSVMSEYTTSRSIATGPDPAPQWVCLKQNSRHIKPPRQ